MYYVVLVLYLRVLGSSLPIHVFTCITSVLQPNTTTLSRPKSVQGRVFKYTSIQRKYSVNTNKYNTRAVFLLTPCSLLQFSCQFFIRGVPVSCGLASEGWGRLRRATTKPTPSCCTCLGWLLALLSNGQQLIPEVELLQLMVDAEHMGAYAQMMVALATAYATCWVALTNSNGPAGPWLYNMEGTTHICQVVLILNAVVQVPLTGIHVPGYETRIRANTRVNTRKYNK